MSSFKSTIRHAESGLHLFITGAVREIENQFAPEQQVECQQALTELFSVFARSLDDWEIPGTFDGIAELTMNDTKRVLLSYLTPHAIDDMIEASNTMPDDVKTLLNEYRTALS